MNKILLINRLDSSNNSNIKKKIFFIIGDMNLSSVENKLIDVINHSELVDSDDMLLKYNGIELSIYIQQIPDIVKLLTRENFSIYGIYERYNPDE